MKRFKQKIKKRAKQEMRDFEAWYHINEYKIINKQIYARNSSAQKPKTETVSNGRFSWSTFVLACANIAVIVVLVLSLMLIPNKLSNEPLVNDDIIAGGTGDSLTPEDIKQSYYDKVFSEYNRVVVESMGFNLPFENITTFAIAFTEDNSMVITGVKGEMVSDDGEKYSVDFYFPQAISKDFDHSPYQNLINKEVVSDYVIDFDISKNANDSYVYKMKITYMQENVCYVDMVCSEEKLDNFIEFLLNEEIFYSTF